MKKNKLLVVIIATCTLILIPKINVFAQVKGYIIKDTVNNRLYEYDRDELVHSFLNNELEKGNNLLFLDYQSKLNNNKMYLFYDDSRKYVRYIDIVEAFNKSKVIGESFYLDEFIKRVHKIETPDYVYDRKIKNGQAINILNFTKDGMVKDFHNKELEGDMKISGNNIMISNVKIKGNLIVDTGEEGITFAKNIKTKDIIALSSGKNSIHFLDVVADRLVINSNKKIGVEIKGKTRIGKTLVQSSAVLYKKEGSYGDITIKIDKEQNKDVELRGIFNENISVESGVKLINSKNEETGEIQIKTDNKEEVILDGSFGNIEIINSSKIKLTEGTKANITAEDNAENGLIVVSNGTDITLKGNINLVGEGKEKVKKISINTSHTSKHKNNTKDDVKDVKPIILTWNNPSGNKHVGDTINITIHSKLADNTTYVNDVKYIMECTKDGMPITKKDITVLCNKTTLYNMNEKYEIEDKHQVKGNEVYIVNVTFNVSGKYNIKIYADR